jgi:hypothetical protein
MSDELERLDRLLAQLGHILKAPGEDDDAGTPEWTWEKLELLESSMGADALTATLRRRGMSRELVDEALATLQRRRAARPDET